MRIVIIHKLRNNAIKNSMPATLTPALPQCTTAASPADMHRVHAAAQTSTAPAARSLESSALLQGQKAVTISHNGSAYRLQSTKLGKLILTK